MFLRPRRARGALLDAQYHASPDGILMVDARARIVSYNRPFQELWKIPAGLLAAGDDEPVLAYAVSQVRDSEGFLKRVRELYDSRTETSYDEFELKDGRTIERYSTTVFAGRRYLGRVWYFRDVSRRIAAEVCRSETEARYGQLFEASADAVILIDLATRRIEDGNRAALRLFGYPKEELLRLKAERLHDEPAMAVRALLGLADGIAWPAPGRHVLRRKDGSAFPAEIAFGRYAQAKQHKAIATIRDLTDRERAAQAEFFRERAQLQRELVATVSHELRTPIAAIQGFAETLLAGALEDQGARRDFVDTIHRHSGRLAKLVEDLLTLSLFESGRRALNPETVDARRFVWDFIAGMEPVARRRGARLKAEISPKLSVQADPCRLTQVLQNLVDNALKYGKPKGALVLIRAERDALPGRAVFSVVDDGPGIAPEHLQRVFEPFHRVDGRRAPGAGLGLAIARQIVQAHGGEIRAESEPGRGCRFRFTLPLPAAPPAARPAAPPAARSATNPKRARAILASARS